MSVRSILALAAGLGLLAGGQAFAQSYNDSDVVVTAPYYAPGDREVHSKAVFTGDLDLSTAAGADTLIGRIRQAARDVCAPAPTHLGELANNADYENCFNGAVERAVYDVDEPTVREAYDYRVRQYARGYNSRRYDDGY